MTTMKGMETISRISLVRQSRHRVVQQTCSKTSRGPFVGLHLKVTVQGLALHILDKGACQHLQP